MRTFLRTTAIRLLVLICLLVTINLASAVILRIVRPGEDTGPDPRAALPNYEDHNRALQALEETSSSQKRVDYIPFIEWKRKPFNGEAVTVGSDGDRVDHFPDPTDPAAKSVHFFGGSTMWGTGVDDNGTIPASFARSNPDLRVLNHAESAFVSRQGLEYLIRLLNEGESIDVAISYDGVNDVANLCRRGISVGGHAEEPDLVEALEEEPSDLSLWGATKRLLFLRTQQLVERLDADVDDADALPGDAPPPDYFACEDDPERTQAVARTLLSNWRHARDISAAEGIEFRAILQPVAHMGSPRLDHLPELSTDNWQLELASQYEVVYPILQEAIADSKEDWMLDMSDAFDGSEQLYIDFCHVTSEGNEIIAAAIDKVVRP